MIAPLETDARTALLRLAQGKEDAKLQLEAACKTFGELGAQPDLKTASDLIEKTDS